MVKLRYRSMHKINAVGPRIRRIRLDEGLEQEQLAARCGVQGWHVTRSTIAKIEAQVRRVTDAELFVLAAALRRPISDLFIASKRDILAQLRHADTT